MLIVSHWKLLRTLLMYACSSSRSLSTLAEQVATTTKRDPLLSQAHHYTQSGWPTKVDSVFCPIGIIEQNWWLKEFVAGYLKSNTQKIL